jgi:murein DD-endopeptidase MepM/ murein hydrolase activator NlpD
LLGHRTRTRTRAGALVGGLAAATALAVIIGAGSAAGGNGGSGGGTTAPKAPDVADVTCLTRCAGLRSATVGSKIEIVGSRLGNVAVVRLKTKEGRIGVAPTTVAKKRVTAVVPDGATNGKVKVVDEFGSRGSDDRKLGIKPQSAIQDPGKFALKTVSALQKRYFADGPGTPTIKFLFESENLVDVRIDLIFRETGEVVRSVVVNDQAPFTTGQVVWDGLTDEGTIAPSGEYRARVSPLSVGSGGAGKLRAEFGYFSHKYPLRGKHSYGDGLGAGRGHMGQDLFAKCGAAVVAARGGVISVKAFQGRAGYYLVIDGKGTGRDYFYAHLKKQGRPKKGTRVKTGEQIGLNGASGNATGCHLHFELWSAPGWFNGGKAVDPTPKLRAWDSWS